jgi:hypothetical protein
MPIHRNSQAQLALTSVLSRRARPQRGYFSREAGASNAIGHWLVQGAAWSSTNKQNKAKLHGVDKVSRYKYMAKLKVKH